jgi:glycine betaine/proline transport system ATP-binding protein|tara:strand:+ start:5630 stop:6823 length:1194 start_codon:yes stop_codon:yes gene_type:complete
MTVEKQQVEHEIVVNNLWKVFGRNPSSALESENLSKSRAEIQEEFGQVVALRDVSFNVQKGETFVVMGLSGSGKSTLVRCLIRLIEATSGNIFVEQEDVTSLDDSALQEFRRSKISMVFQNFGLLPHRNVMDNACYGLEVKGMSREERYERAQKMLDLVGLSGWERSRVRQLSGGMQQRVGLARALAVEPEILLMDEPFSGLDPLIRRQMRSELADLQKELKKTMVFITHDLDEAVSVGDRIAIMRDGEIIQMGTPREIIMNPADEFVSEFTEDVSKDRVLNASSVSVSPDLTYTYSADLDKLKSKVSTTEAKHVAFVNESGSSLGVLMRADIEKAISIEDIDRFMEKSPDSVSRSSNIKSAIGRLSSSETPIPVVDSERNLLGVITQTSMLNALSE